MKSFVLFLTAFSLFSCTNVSDSDKEAVRKVVLDFQEDFSDGTFKKAEQYADEDWEHINPVGGIDRGKDAVLKTVRGAHQAFLKNVGMTTDSMNVRFVSPDVALVTAFHTIDNYITPDSVKHFNERHIKTYVIVKKQGSWLMTLDHNTIIQAWPQP